MFLRALLFPAILPGGETFFNQIAHKMHVDPGDAILIWNVKKVPLA